MKTTLSLALFLLWATPFFAQSITFAGGDGDGGANEQYSGAAATLPLTILSFTAEATDGAVELYWLTVDEVDTDFFTVERSADGISFAAISRLSAAGHAGGQERSYVHTDRQPLAGTAYYRLRVTDFDGAITLSSVVTVQGAAPAFTLYPNPTHGVLPRLSIPAAGTESDSRSITVYDQRGRNLFQLDLPRTGGPAQLPQLPVGTYQVELSTAGNLRTVQTLLVTKAP